METRYGINGLDILVEDAPPEIQQYLCRGPNTQKWMNATPDDPSGIIRTQYMLYVQGRSGDDRALALACWEEVWKRWDKDNHAIKNALTQFKNSHWDRSQMAIRTVKDPVTPSGVSAIFPS